MARAKLAACACEALVPWLRQAPALDDPYRQRPKSHLSRRLLRKSRVRSLQQMVHLTSRSPSPMTALKTPFSLRCAQQKKNLPPQKRSSRRKSLYRVKPSWKIVIQMIRWTQSRGRFSRNAAQKRRSKKKVSIQLLMAVKRLKFKMSQTSSLKSRARHL